MSGKLIIIRLLEIDSFEPILGLHLIKEHFPHAAFSFRRQFAVTQRDVDARLESVVKGLDAVGGKKEDPLEVFEQSEEDAHERVAVDVLDGAFFEKHVRFVKQQDGAPGVCDVEDFV